MTVDPSSAPLPVIAGVASLVVDPPVGEVITGASGAVTSGRTHSTPPSGAVALTFIGTRDRSTLAVARMLIWIRNRDWRVADPVDPEFIYGFVRGCEFSNGGSSGNVFRLENVSTDSRFIERDNAFFGFTTAYIHSNSVPYNDTIVVTYGSREGAQFSLTNSGFTTLTISAPLQYERFVVAHTNASNLTLTFTGTDRPFGLSWDAVVLNNSGGARDIIFVGSGQSITLSAVPDGGRAIAHYFTYLETPNTVAVGIASTATALT